MYFLKKRKKKRNAFIEKYKALVESAKLLLNSSDLSRAVWVNSVLNKLEGKK